MPLVLDVSQSAGVVPIDMREMHVRALAFTGQVNSDVVDGKIEVIGPGFEDMERRCPNIQKIKDLIGYQPTQDLEAIIQSVIDYFKE